MPETPESDNDRHQAGQLAASRKDAHGSQAPAKKQIASTDYKKWKNLLRKKWNNLQRKRIIRKGFAGLGRWIRDHDGWVTAAATVAIAFLTWSLATDSQRQAEYVEWQLKVMRGQLGVMEADQRAWIRPQVTPASDWMFTERSIGIQLKVDIKNIGKMAAFDIGEGFDFYVLDPHEPNKAFEIRPKACRDAEAETRDGGRSLLFPDDLHAFPILGVTIDKSDAAEKAIKMPDGSLVILPRLIGCITYRYGGSDIIHHTEITYEPEHRGGFMVNMNPIKLGDYQLAEPIKGQYRID